MPRVTKEHNTRVIKQLYDNQDHRCAVCDLEIEYKDEKAHTVRKYTDRSGLVVCPRCNFMVNYVRRHIGPTLDRAIRLVKTGKV